MTKGVSTVIIILVVVVLLLFSSIFNSYINVYYINELPQEKLPTYIESLDKMKSFSVELRYNWLELKINSNSSRDGK